MSAEVEINEVLVRRLIAAQFPQWKDLPITPVEAGGIDNRTFHLGARMTVRLPSAAGSAHQVEKEHRWLPQLAPLLPLPIPVPLAKGNPAEEYPWPWSVYGWLDGESATLDRIADLRQFALALAQFLVALREIDPAGGPLPGPHNFHRGGPLAYYDAGFRRALAELAGEIDTVAASAMWEATLVEEWRGPPVWFHGDISWGNLLVQEGRLSAVIDFGGVGIGDPSCDLAIAWTLFSGESRDAFRASLQLDDATWARGRGWALWKALITLAGLLRAHPGDSEKARLVINEVIADHQRGA